MYSLFVSLRARPSRELWDALSILLFDNDAQGIDEGEEDPPAGESALVAADEFVLAIQPGVLQPPQAFTAYFLTHDRALHGQALVEANLEELSPQFQISEVEDKNYDEAWKASFRPLHCPPFWLIHAPWHRAADLDRQPGERSLIIEPGMAFGTGTHETTRSCLELMVGAASQSTGRAPSSDTAPATGLSVLDFGCGSGILAIGAKLLGAAKVWAVDIDPLALDATHLNADRNDITVETLFEAPSFNHGVDLIVANILKNTLLDFAPRFQSWLKQGGRLILSGLLVDQESTIVEAYQSRGFTLETRLIKGEWASVQFRL